MNRFHLDDIRTWHHKKILIIGYGKEGRCAETYIQSYAPDNEVHIIEHTSGSAFIQTQQLYDFAIKSPGVPPELVTIPYTTATNLFFAHCGTSKVIGVTGTKGKSTSSSLLAHILQTASRPAVLVGNIGVPALEFIGTNVLQDTWFVFELSSYQLGDCRYSPHVALVMSLFPEHMNYHGSVASYYEAKHNIIKYQTESDYFVYNPQNPILAKWAEHAVSKSIPFEKTSIAQKSQLRGAHNEKNIEGVVTVARLLAIPDEIIASAVGSFSPLTHRLQNIGTYRQITFYDDAISTTPQSTIAALDALENVQTLLLGGLDRGYDFSTLCDRIKQSPIRTIILFPDSGEKIKSLLVSRGSDISFFETTSMKEAVAIAYKHTSPGADCLLSTASPSYTLWKNFEDKGAQFQLYVSEYSDAT